MKICWWHFHTIFKSFGLLAFNSLKSVIWPKIFLLVIQLLIHFVLFFSFKIQLNTTTRHAAAIIFLLDILFLFIIISNHNTMYHHKENVVCKVTPHKIQWSFKTCLKISGFSPTDKILWKWLNYTPYTNDQNSW